MSTLTAKKSVFEIDNETFENRVKPVAAKAQQTALDNGAWFSYKNELCVDADMFVREFKDGHKELVKIGKQPGEHTVLKVFNA
jgi:hypothetical protein